jgi:hypothetical protein
MIVTLLLRNESHAGAGMTWLYSLIFQFRWYIMNWFFWRAAAAAAADDLLLGHFGPELLEDDFCLGVVVAYLELEIGLRLTSCWIWSMHDNGLGGQFVQVTDWYCAHSILRLSINSDEMGYERTIW